ncbi:GMC oxidoreductase [Cubamyces sp. BRFM 1775]|nr:GMC oxidoreductase [Cubamyces sp. BRFM 1775]
MFSFSSQQTPTLTPEEVGTPTPFTDTAFEGRTYDYIIVGGGTAGCCLASRLSEDPDVTVLLLERGGIANGWADKVPLISSNPYREGAPTSRWWSQPLPWKASDGRSLAQEVVCGEALGGTSVINCTFYTRGPAGDYNHWEELGNQGWGYKDVESYFAKSETTHSHPSSQFRGKQGELTQVLMPSIVIRAAENAGLQPMDDLNSPHAPAAGYVRHDVSQDKSMRRHTPFHAFLPPPVTIGRAKRLKICTNVLVTRLELAQGGSDGLRATGVHFEAMDYRKAGKHFFARARREVVICAGAISSPQILQLSGLGPEDHLRAKGVPVMRNMPGVGNHLQDHIAVPLTFEAPMHDSIHELEASPWKVIKELTKYTLTGHGVFSYPFQAITMYLPSKLLSTDGSRVTLPADKPEALDTSVLANCPDLEIMPAPSNCTDHDIPGKGIFTLMVGLIRPKSHGSVRIATSNPRARPEVDLNFLTDPGDNDLARLRAGMRLTFNLAEDIRKQGYPLKSLIVPEKLEDQSLNAFIKDNMRTCYHYTSTCRMGREDESERPGVVDAELRVHGVQGLRVCDASVFPEIVGAHTMAPTVMVAEKCADLMKESRKSGKVEPLV